MFKQKKKAIAFIGMILMLGFVLLIGNCNHEKQPAREKTPAPATSISATITRLNSLHVCLTELPDRESIAKGYLNNAGSGYPDLVETIFKAIQCPGKNCRVQGPLLPLEVIEVKCRTNRGNPNQVILKHTIAEVQQGYVDTWYERAPANATLNLTLNQILSGEL
jgi:hypothetical protein